MRMSEPDGRESTRAAERLHLMQSRKYLTRDEAAEHLADLGIPVRSNTLARWACTGRYALPMIKLGRLVRYDVQDLDAFVERHRITPGGDDTEQASRR